MAAYLSSPDRWIGVAENPDSDLMGFIEVSTRHDYVEGCKNSPVAYLKGLYVKDSYRNQGVAKNLIATAEQWVREKGFNEIASDTDLDNNMSIQMHVKLGFTEANRNVHFIKRITDE